VVLHDDGDRLHLLHGAILAETWQKINQGWLFCHSRLDHDGGMITAMTYLMILLVIAAVMAAGTVKLVLHDGRGPAAPPSSHFRDPQFTSPAAGR
jgi:hypothetical protein